jgi:hypothetical protein
MAYTVKQVAAMSGVSVRALHFYDETGLLEPAYYGANGYRFYEEPQLLTLQQILFYRELGFELKQIKRVQLLILQAFPRRFEGKRAVFQGLMGQGAAEKEYGAYPCRYLHAARSLLHEDSR